MKWYWKTGLWVVLVVLMASCSDPVKSIVGGYSYQIAKQEVSIDDTIAAVLTSEIGALQIEAYHDSVILLTFNSLKGDVYTTTGTISDGGITLDPFSRTLTITYTVSQEDFLRPTEKTLTETYNIDVSGEAEIHDETIHFALRYDGTGVSNDKQLTGEDILMVAKRN